MHLNLVNSKSQMCTAYAASQKHQWKSRKTSVALKKKNTASGQKRLRQFGKTSALISLELDAILLPHK